MFLLLIRTIFILLVLRIVIAESLSMKRISGPTPYTITPKPSTLNPETYPVSRKVAPTPSLGGERLPCLSEGGAYPVSQKGAPTLSLGGGAPTLSLGGGVPTMGGAASAPGWGGLSAWVGRRKRRGGAARAPG